MLVLLAGKENTLDYFQLRILLLPAGLQPGNDLSSSLSASVLASKTTAFLKGDSWHCACRLQYQGCIQPAYNEQGQ